MAVVLGLLLPQTNFRRGKKPGARQRRSRTHGHEYFLVFFFKIFFFLFCFQVYRFGLDNWREKV